MKVLAVIPARSGSVRVKNKNIRDFHGKPLLAWSVQAALDSNHIDKVIVSTNCEEIAETARQYGAEVPFLRPDELANHTSGVEPVLQHAFEYFRDQGEKYDAITLLMPTNPLRNGDQLDRAISLFKSHDSISSVVTVHEAAGNKNPHWILKREEEGLKFFTGNSIKNIITRSQDLPICYSRNDIAYVIKSENLYDKPQNLYGNTPELLVMDDFYDADINTEEDWHIAYDKFRRKYIM